MNRIADSRIVIKTLEQADQIMAALSKVEATKVLEKARANSKIATVKANLVSRLSDLENQRRPLAKRLAKFITSNTGLFHKPRKRKTETGSYGLQKVSEVIVDDEEAVLKWIDAGDDREYMVKTVRTPIKSELETFLAEGIEIPGCYLNTGDTSVYKTNPELIKEAKTRGTS